MTPLSNRKQYICKSIGRHFYIFKYKKVIKLPEKKIKGKLSFIRYLNNISFATRQKHGTVEDPFEVNRKTKNKDKQASGISKPHSNLGPSPFTGKPDPMALARATLNAGQTQGQRPSGPPTLGLSTANNAFGMPAAGATPAANPFGTSSGGFGFGTQSNTSGIGAATNPFGASASSSSIFGNTSATNKPNLTLGFGQSNSFGAQSQASNLPTFGQSNTFGTPQSQTTLTGGFGAQSATGGFGAPQPASNFSFGTPSAAAGAGTPGLFGSTMSPFGQQQVLGKRGKH